MTAFAFYGGKGGVGKTTCATARALAEAAKANAVLVVSTDPAHSLADAIGKRLSASPTPITRRLDAVELDGSRAFARWLSGHRRALGDILEHGTWLDRADVESFLDLPLPGIDELVGLIEIDRLADLHRYDLIVVDTAPTGHTLRLLSAPDTVAALARVLDSMEQEHRLIRERFARIRRPEAADGLIALIAEQARDTAGRLRDPRQTTFHWVTLPEAMSSAESRDAVAALDATGISVGEIIVNRVIPRGGRGRHAEVCPICDRRRADQEREVVDIRRTIGRGRRVRVLPAELTEPRGIAALDRLGRRLIGRVSRERAVERTAGVGRGRARTMAFSAPPDDGTRDPASIGALRDARILFFGGKGGVGKTTVAAAAAISLARAEPRRRFMLLSTDPAHSLGDVFGSPLSDLPRTPAGAPKNLAVRELDAQKALSARRREFVDALDEIASAFGASAPTPDLLDLAPPGIDELFGIIEVVSARAAYDTIIVDTAPTGHALRLLETPAAARDWINLLMRMLLKYRSLARPGRLARELLDTSHAIRSLQDVLRDPAAARFVVVTRAAVVPRIETERLLARLQRQRLATPAIVIDALTLAPGDCPRCQLVASAERRERGAIRKHAGRRVIIETPLAAPSPRGARQLLRWGRTWMASR